jgi:hypothetical protein
MSKLPDSIREIVGDSRIVYERREFELLMSLEFPDYDLHLDSVPSGAGTYRDARTEKQWTVYLQAFGHGRAYELKKSAGKF